MSRRLVFGFLFAAVAAFWAVMMVLLVQRSVSTQGPGLEVPASLAGENSTEWMSIYLSGEKIGNVVSLTTRTEEGYQSVESSYMRFGLSGTDQDMKTFVRAESDREYRLTSFSFEIKSKHQALKASGEVREGALEVVLNSGGQIQKMSFPLPEDTYMPFSIAPLIEDKGLGQGDSIGITIFDPSVFQPAVMWIRHLGDEKLEHLDRTVEATHLSTSFLGARMDMWIDDAGRSLRQEGPMGLLILEEPREMAERFPERERPVELLTLFSIPSDVRIPEPRSLTYMKAELSGVEINPSALSNNRQKVSGTRTFIVEIRMIAPRPGSRPDTAVSLQRYLEPEALLQVDHPRIRATADSIADGLEDPWERVRAIAGWVHDRLEKSPTVSLPSALDVLQSGRGDCNEHAVLVAALCRAASVPSTIVSGVVYLEGSFYYHAWNRVYVGEWIDLDATFGQEIADATHLMLAEGGIENQAAMTHMIGGLKLRVLEHR